MLEPHTPEAEVFIPTTKKEIEVAQIFQPWVLGNSSSSKGGAETNGACKSFPRCASPYRARPARLVA
jgi:hypothetical protein